MRNPYSRNLTNPQTLNDNIFFGYTGNVELTGDGYVQIPSGDDAARPAEPEVGMVRYNTDSTAFEGYGASGWGSIGGNSTEFVTYFYDSGAAPVAIEPNTGYVGQNRGSMLEVSLANSGTLGFGPASTEGDPTLSHLTFYPNNGRFYGFLPGAVYQISTSFIIQNDGTGSGNIAASLNHNIDVRSGPNFVTDAMFTYVKLPDSNYGGVNYNPWEQSVNMSCVARFDDAPENNYVRFGLNGNQSNLYYVTYGYLNFVRIA